MAIVIPQLNSASLDNRPTRYIKINWSFDANDLQTLARKSDYVFAAKVEGVGMPAYKNNFDKSEQDNDHVEGGTPYTKYAVTILTELKGKLPNNYISLYKTGGLVEDGSEVCLEEGDIFPQNNRFYLFYAFTKQDGSLVLAGSNATIPLELNSTLSVQQLREVINSNALVQQHKKSIATANKD